MMDSVFHENKTHGTSIFPLQIYSHHDKNGFYFVSQHWHEELEWVYVEYGILQLVIHGKQYQLNPGEFCFINAGELHEIKSVGNSLHHAIVFRPSLLDFALYDACQHNFIRPITSQKLLFPSICDHMEYAKSQTILSSMHAIVKLYHSLPTCALLSIKIHLLHILELLFQSDCFLENTSTTKEQNSLNKLKRTIDYMKENYSSSISLESLAKLAFMSPNYFCRYFRQEIGKPPIVFLNEYRIQQASRLLSESDLPISQIALSVGFDNFSYFTRKFREYKRISPREYRLIWNKQL